MLDKRQEWRTPRGLFDNLNREFSFTVDAAASPANALLKTYWTEHEDALKQDWTGHTVFCNPPFGQIKKWVAKAHRSCVDNGVLSVFLLPQNLSSSWFVEYCSGHTIRIFNKRIAYVPPVDSDVVASTPMAGSIIVIFDPSWPLSFPIVDATMCDSTGAILGARY